MKIIFIVEDNAVTDSVDIQVMRFAHESDLKAAPPVTQASALADVMEAHLQVIQSRKFDELALKEIADLNIEAAARLCH